MENARLILQKMVDANNNTYVGTLLTFIAEMTNGNAEMNINQKMALEIIVVRILGEEYNTEDNLPMNARFEDAMPIATWINTCH
jgi:hypothetical protein